MSSNGITKFDRVVNENIRQKLKQEPVCERRETPPRMVWKLETRQIGRNKTN